MYLWAESHLCENHLSNFDLLVFGFRFYKVFFWCNFWFALISLELRFEAFPNVEGTSILNKLIYSNVLIDLTLFKVIFSI